jgi:hypothetical protein
MWRSPTVMAVFSLVVISATSAQEEIASPTGAKVWVGRHGEFEEYLRTAPIEKVEDVGEGVTRPRRAFFAPGGLAGAAIVKRLPPKARQGYWESYKSEIAAYELDRLLELDMVPVTVERRVEGDLVSAQLWLNGCRLLRDAAAEVPRHPRQWARQVCRQRIFDALSANIDRNAGNLLIDSEWNLILIDHSRAFAKNDMPFLDDIIQTDRQLFAAMKALDEATLVEKLRPWLFGDGSVRDLLERRDRIVERLEQLIAKRGEAAVFPFDLN